VIITGGLGLLPKSCDLLPSALTLALDVLPPNGFGFLNRRFAPSYLLRCQLAPDARPPVLFEVTTPAPKRTARDIVTVGDVPASTPALLIAVEAMEQTIKLDDVRWLEPCLLNCLFQLLVWWLNRSRFRVEFPTENLY
jgi:hypothetical protein